MIIFLAAPHTGPVPESFFRKWPVALGEKKSCLRGRDWLKAAAAESAKVASEKSRSASPATCFGTFSRRKGLAQDSRIPDFTESPWIFLLTNAFRLLRLSLVVDLLTVSRPRGNSAFPLATSTCSVTHARKITCCTQPRIRNVASAAPASGSNRTRFPLALTRQSRSFPVLLQMK